MLLTYTLNSRMYVREYEVSPTDAQYRVFQKADNFGKYTPI